MIRKINQKLAEGNDISYEEASEAMKAILEGKASLIETGVYLTALKVKGETIDEISASAITMLKYSTKMECGFPLLEVVGTGGDHSNSFNISTISAIIASSAGIPVAKHGNRAYTSKCGAADVLEALGYKIDISVEASRELLEKTGFCFLFAQQYNGAVKYVSPVRKELGFSTIFNIIGPLCNPAGPSKMLVGVYSEEMVTIVAAVLANMGVESAMVVCGMDGLDEISVSAPTKICKYKNGKFYEDIIYPEMFGCRQWDKRDIEGGGPEQNAEIIKNVLLGEKGAKRDISILNAAAAIYVGSNFSITMHDAVEIAKDKIDSQKAIHRLKQIIQWSNTK